MNWQWRRKMRDINEVREAFYGDAFATQTTGVELLEIGPCYTKCRLQLSEKHLNAIGTAMGGAIYTLADFAFAVAANMEVLNTVTAGSNISFINPSKGDVLYAEAKCIKDGRTLVFYEVTITDEFENIVSVVNFTGTKIKK